MTDEQEYALFCQSYALFLKELGRDPEKPPAFAEWLRRREQMRKIKTVLDDEVADHRAKPKGTKS